MEEFEAAALKRVVPHNDDAEKSVIGSILVDNSCLIEISEILIDGSKFYNHAYGVMYDAMLELRRKGSVIDAVTLVDKLKEKNIAPEACSPEVIANIVLSVLTTANSAQYARIVYEKATMRELIKTMEDLTNDCYAGKDDLNTILEETEKQIFKVTQKKNVGKVTPISTIVAETLNIIETAARTTGEVTGLATGFYDLDKLTTGFRPGNLVLIAARPAMGKTSFVLSLAKNIILQQHKSIAMFSLEMADTELVLRMLSMASRVDSQKFKSGDLNEGDWECIVESGGEIADSKLILDDSSTRIDEIRSKCRKFKAEHDIQLVIIDYLQLMNGSGRTDSRQQEISEISRALKLMAKELKIPVIALSQLSRQVEQRPDHRPMLSDLRESGAIEQDADTVIFIYRDEVYHPEKEESKNIGELIIAKQRSGPTGRVELLWVPENTEFKNKAFRSDGF